MVNEFEVQLEPSDCVSGDKSRFEIDHLYCLGLHALLWDVSLVYRVA